MKKTSLRLWRITFTIILAAIVILVGCANGAKNINKKTSVTDSKIRTHVNTSPTTNNFNGITLINGTVNIQVLCYHSIQADPSRKNSIVDTVDSFRQNLQAIKDGGYTTLTMTEFNNYINNNQAIPPKSVVLTFDDGYVDNYSVLFPLLKEFNMKATIFVIAKNLTVNGYLNTQQVKEMSDYGIDIQCHTYSHRELGKLSYGDQYDEMKKSKEILEKVTGKPVFAIAYPSGSFNDDTDKAAKKSNLKLGFTTNKGYVQRGDNVLFLNRTCIDYTYNYYYMKKLLQSTQKS